MTPSALASPSRPLTTSELLAANLMVEGRMTMEEIAREIDVSRETLYAWRKLPTFRAHVEMLRAEFREIVMASGIAIRENRIASLNGRWKAMQELLEARGAEHVDVPGGKTGLLVKQVKGIGSGENFSEVEEFVFDKALLSEMRETEKQAAMEVGQWTEKREMSGPGGGPIEVSSVREQILGRIGSYAARISEGEGDRGTGPDQISERLDVLGAAKPADAGGDVA